VIPTNESLAKLSHQLGIAGVPVLEAAAAKAVVDVQMSNVRGCCLDFDTSLTLERDYPGLSRLAREDPILWPVLVVGWTILQALFCAIAKAVAPKHSHLFAQQNILYSMRQTKPLR
jgi:hypothetical protein